MERLKQGSDVVRFGFLKCQASSAVLNATKAMGRGSRQA